MLVTGATGYVGGRVIPALLEAGFTVRACSRRATNLDRFDWADRVERAEADLADPGATAAAMAGVDVVLYLVHSMAGAEEDFEAAEARVARVIAEAAAAAGVRQIVYLSGLHPRTRAIGELSKHMRSREAVARILLDSPTPALVLRAATLIGSGSASFEIIRHLAERLPLMIAPRWIGNRIEPLSIRDCLHYLVGAADLAEPVNRSCDIGCGVSYRFADLLRGYAEAVGLTRRVVALPWPLPVDGLSGAWIGLVTPVPAALAVPLAQSMAEDAVCEERSIRELIPDPPGGLADYRTAVARALARELGGGVPTSWDGSWRRGGDAAASAPGDPGWSGHTVYRDLREETAGVDPALVWEVVEGIGGDAGWYSAPRLWRLRGILDALIGGPGLGGRRDPRRLAVGDRVDWWRVAEIRPGRRLVLRAEMRLDGAGWLILEVDPDGPGGTRYRQTAVYVPRGLVGRAYWWAVYPFHGLVFPAMARGVLAEARRRAAG